MVIELTDAERKIIEIIDSLNPLEEIRIIADQNGKKGAYEIRRIQEIRGNEDILPKVIGNLGSFEKIETRREKKGDGFSYRILKTSTILIQ